MLIIDYPECCQVIKKLSSIFYRGDAKARRFAEGFGLEIVDFRLGNTRTLLQTL